MSGHEHERLSACLNDELAPAEMAAVRAASLPPARTARRGSAELGAVGEGGFGAARRRTGRATRRPSGARAGPPRTASSRATVPAWTWAAAAALLLAVIAPLMLLQRPASGPSGSAREIPAAAPPTCTTFRRWPRARKRRAPNRRRRRSAAAGRGCGHADAGPGRLEHRFRGVAEEARALLRRGTAGSGRAHARREPAEASGAGAPGAPRAPAPRGARRARTRRRLWHAKRPPKPSCSALAPATRRRPCRTRRRQTLRPIPRLRPRWSGAPSLASAERVSMAGTIATTPAPGSEADWRRLECPRGRAPRASGGGCARTGAASRRPLPAGRARGQGQSGRKIEAGHGVARRERSGGQIGLPKRCLTYLDREGHESRRRACASGYFIGDAAPRPPSNPPARWGSRIPPRSAACGLVPDAAPRPPSDPPLRSLWAREHDSALWRQEGPGQRSRLWRKP